MTGDSFCRRRGIDHIDLLKIDTEGHDLEVLRGFAQMLTSQAIDVVQFEFTLLAIHARVWLGDFYRELAPRGFAIGKLYPTWIEWKDYDPHDEVFLRCNYVAARPGTPQASALGL